METGPSHRPQKPAPANVQKALDKLYASHPEALEWRKEREDFAHGPRPRVLRPPVLHVPVAPPATPRTEVEQLELIPDEKAGGWIKKQD